MNRTYTHQCDRLRLSLLSLGKVKIHLISVKIRVKRVTAAFIKSKRPVRHHFSLQVINNINRAYSGAECQSHMYMYNVDSKL